MFPPLTSEGLLVASLIWHFSLGCPALGVNQRCALCLSSVHISFLSLTLSSCLLVKIVLYLTYWSFHNVRLVSESKRPLDVCGQSFPRSVWNRGLENVDCHSVCTSSEMWIVPEGRPAFSTPVRSSGCRGERGGLVMVPCIGLEGQRRLREFLVNFIRGLGTPNLGPVPMRTLKFPRHL